MKMGKTPALSAYLEAMSFFSFLLKFFAFCSLIQHLLSLFSLIHCSFVQTEKVVNVVGRSAWFFSWFVTRKTLRQTTAACNRLKNSVDEYGGVISENIKFSGYDDFRSQGAVTHAAC